MTIECIKIEPMDQVIFPKVSGHFRFHLLNSDEQGLERRRTLCGVDTSRFTAPQTAPDYMNFLFLVCSACRRKSGLEAQ